MNAHVRVMKMKTIPILASLLIIGCSDTYEYSDPADAFRERSPEMAERFVSLRRTSVEIIEEHNSDWDSRSAAIAKGIRRYHKDPDSLLKLAGRLERSANRSITNNADWISMKRRMKPQDALYFFDYEVPDAEGLIGFEGGHMILRDGEIVFVSLLADMVDGGLRNRDEL